MSRAHRRETDGDIPEDLPELPLSPEPNYVTPRGLALLRERLRQSALALAAGSEAAADARQARARIERERRWLEARLAAAQVVPSHGRNPDRIVFGAIVTLDIDGDNRRFQIVGEDEAEPGTGRISWTSPLARALIGAERGALVIWPRPAGDLEVEILSIDYPADAGSAAG